MAVDVIIDPSSGQIYWNDQAGSGTQTIAISGNATNAINVVGYSNFFSAGGGGLGTQILATFTDSPTSTFTPGTNAYDLGSSSLRWNFYGTGGNFTGAISTSSSTGSTNPTTGALIVTGGVGIGGTVNVGTSAVTSTFGTLLAGFAASVNSYPAYIQVENTSSNFGSDARLRLTTDAGTASIFLRNSNFGSQSSELYFGSPGPIRMTSGSGHTITLLPTGGSAVLINTSTTLIELTTVSTSSTTGALTVSGGAGIAKTSYFGQSVVIQGTTASGSTTTGALVVSGGVGIGGSLQVFGTIDVSNNIEVLSQKEVRFFNSANTFYTGLRAGSSSANVTFTLPIADGSANQVLYTNGSAALGWTTVASVSAITTLNGLTASTQTFATGTSGTDFNISSSSSTHTFNIPYAGSGSTGLITTQTQTIAGAKTFSGQTSITNSTASTSTTTGALIISGGVGIAGSIWSGQHIVTDTTASTTTATGAMLIFGGLGVSGQVNAVSLQTSGNAVISGNLTFNGVGVFGNATSDTINSLARYISDILPSTDNSYDLGNNSLGWRNFRVSGVGTIATLQVTSVTSGLWAGTAITLAYGGTNNNISGVGHSYRVAVYDAAGTAITNISSVGTASSVLFQTSQSVSPIWAGQSQLVVGGASTAANIQGGALGNVLYQTGANTSGFVTNAAGSGASILSQTGNAAPLFLGQSQLVVGGASTSAQWQTSRTVTFATGDVTGSFSINGSADVSNVALTIAANSVALGTDTTGSYAQSVAVAGSGLTLGGTAGEGTDFTVYSNGTSANTVSTLVFRDGSGNFSAGTITANLTGTASIASSSAAVNTVTDTASTLYLLGSRSSTGIASTQVYVDTNISILGSQVTAGVWGGTAISAVNGGTGQVSYTIGDILYASSTTALSKLSAGTAGSVLASGGAGAAPYWKVDATGGGGGSPAGSTSQLQYNNGGAFGATSGLTFNINGNNEFIVKTPYLVGTQGVINIGPEAFDGVTLGQFAGSSNGTQIAVNTATGFIGNFADFQIRGSSKFTIGYDGKITVVGVYSLPTTAGTAGSVLTSNGTGNQFYWTAPGSAGGGAGTVASGTANQVAIYAATGASVSGAANLTYNTTSVTITNTTASNNNSSGALLVHGGIGASGQISGAGASFTSTVFLNGIRIGQGGNNITFTDSAGTTIGSFNTSNGWLKSDQTTQSTTSGTGALVSAGGLGVAKAASIGETIYALSTVNSTSLSTGALVVSGGAGIAKTMFVGDNINIFKSGSVGALRLWNSAQTFYTGLQAGNPAANTTYTLPITFPGTAGSTLISDTSGVMSWAAPGTVTTLTAGNGITFSTGTTITTTGTIRRRTSYNLVFMSGYTPNVSGVDTVVLRVPDSAADAGNVVYNCREVTLRVETATAGTSTINIQKYGIATGTGTSLFSTTSTGSTTNILSAALSITGATTYEAASTTFAAGHGTCATGDKLRVNFTALNASHTNFTISLMIEEQ